jgi:hypothetical protein
MSHLIRYESPKKAWAGYAIGENGDKDRLI